MAKRKIEIFYEMTESEQSIKRYFEIRTATSININTLHFHQIFSTNNAFRKIYKGYFCNVLLYFSRERDDISVKKKRYIF